MFVLIGEKKGRGENLSSFWRRCCRLRLRRVCPRVVFKSIFVIGALCDDVRARCRWAVPGVPGSCGLRHIEFWSWSACWSRQKQPGSCSVVKNYSFFELLHLFSHRWRCDLCDFFVCVCDLKRHLCWGVGILCFLRFCHVQKSSLRIAKKLFSEIFRAQKKTKKYFIF